MQQLENNNVNKKYNWWRSVSLLAGITFFHVTIQDFRAVYIHGMVALALFSKIVSIFRSIHASVQVEREMYETTCRDEIINLI